MFFFPPPVLVFKIKTLILKNEICYLHVLLQNLLLNVFGFGIWDFVWCWQYLSKKPKQNNNKSDIFKLTHN